ncbi:TPA: hypothetical protein MEC17_000252 [Klebsiella pneumoniae]|uniref:AbiTii domain-containing protein n=1 Tax=Klebsiella pneumoniae TaxID=573 RepID=UPI000C7D5434|nr:hypothetical protein [Klebsiella pneumoniae]EIX9106397.1 hypothetical protein [Klebsiella pneumoniae]EIY1879748.1 hypothetical protein [Klebsiella pneumoniae]EKJ7635794.1 hypothetical protein [Klebsiella pneumoniae]MCQ0531487.1 hypothetical protein [Klebsiella pneumoniae]MCQ0574314.1 hypothetical protein [Klebsiella pneumoniae]
MSLLREIQQAAIDPSIDLPSLLRKCKVLASRLGNQEFKQWVNFELNGYPDLGNLPDYRIFDVEVRGYFTGSFHRVLNNANVPPSCIPKELREALFTCRMNTPVAALVSLTKNSDGIAQEPWNADVTAYVGRQIIQDMNCLRAWKVIPVNLLASILDVIRTKILDFALEIEAENPEAGEAQPNTQPIPQEKVQQVFNTYIVGNGNNIATASQHVSQEANNTDTHAEVFSQLLDALRSVSDESVTETITATVEEMRAAKDKPGFLAHYTQFTSLLADHVQILGPVVAPFLPMLAKMLS